jgi:hypothetical protein
MFYCERGVGFCRDIGYQDEAYFNALVRTFEQALKAIDRLPASEVEFSSAAWIAHELSATLGYGVGENMDSLRLRYASG